MNIVARKDLDRKEEVPPVMMLAFGPPFTLKQTEQMIRLDPRLNRSAIGFCALENDHVVGFRTVRMERINMYGHMYVDMEVLFPSGEASKPPHAHIKTTQGGGHLVKPAESALHSDKTPPAALSRHPWRSRQGEKRTIIVPYEPTEPVLTYLKDMKDALGMALTQGYVLARRDTSHEVPNPVALRRRVKP